MTFNRPDHPDFWLLAEVVQDLDTAAMDGLALERIIGRIDLESVAYTAWQRVMRADKLEMSQETAGAIWIDGFMAGVNFHKRKTNRVVQVEQGPLTDD